MTCGLRWLCSATWPFHIGRAMNGPRTSNQAARRSGEEDFTFRKDMFEGLFKRQIDKLLFVWGGGDYQKNDQLHTGMVPPNAGSIGVDFDSTGTYIYIYIYRWNYSNSISLFFFRNLLVGSRLANCAWKRRSSTWFNVPLKLSISDADVLKSTHETLMLPFYRSRTWWQSQDASCPMEMLFGL